MLEAKVVLLRGTEVGKTAIVTKITTGGFDSQIKPTVGASYASRVVEIKGKPFKLQI
jgi:GTPase SAR1 family protein